MLFTKHFLLAVQFFTRIPVTGRLAAWVGFSPEMLRASAAHFAGVGWIVGIFAAAVFAAVHLLLAGTFASWVAACLALVSTVLLTGGFHEDGLADLADGLGGAYDRERALEIMKDSRIGAFGAMALVLALMTKVSLLAALGDQLALTACVIILCGHVVSRALPMVLVAMLPHVGDAAGSKSKPLADRISHGALASNFVWCAALVPLIYIESVAIEFIVGAALAGVACWFMGWRLQRRLQGFTGDALGATQQVCEIAFLLGAAVVASKV